MGKQKSFLMHEFYCMNCGNRSYSLPRKQNKMKEKFHRKALFCPHCKCDVNHIECRNDEEILEFKEAFENGDYAEEATNSMAFIRDTWGWERQLPGSRKNS